VFPCSPFASGNVHIGHVRSYTISDAYARFRRALGDAVLFSLGYDAFGLPNEIAAIRNAQSPKQWVQQCRDKMTAQFERLGLSFDWSRTFLSSDEDNYRWSQWIFLRFFQMGLIYRAGGRVDWCDQCRTALARLQAKKGRCWRCDQPVRLVERVQWYLKTSVYMEEMERGLPALEGWDRALVDGQRSLIGRTSGFEVDVRTREGVAFPAFTPYPDSAAAAAFVLVSPDHPDLPRLTLDAGVREAVASLRLSGWGRSDRGDEEVPLVVTGLSVLAPGLARDLPVVVSPAVDAFYGGGALLGTPELDPTHATIARRLGISIADGRWGGPDGELRRAVRYRNRDFMISRQRCWGAPIPIVYCPACGVVPVPEQDLPVRLPDDLLPSGEGNALEQRPEFVACPCPACGGEARRETDTMDCHVDALWMYAPHCVPPDDRRRQMFDHPELRRWLPVEQVHCGADLLAYMMNFRFFTKALRDAGFLTFLEDGEPVRNMLMHEMITFQGRKMSKHLGNVVDPDLLVRTYGADATRLGVLYAANPRKKVTWSDSPVRDCHGFLSALWEFVHDRAGSLRDAGLGAGPSIDLSDPMRRKLARWCEAAINRTTRACETQHFHTAIRNVRMLFERLQRFESSPKRRGGKQEPLDREAMAIVTRVLLGLLAPLAPHVAEELWETCGGSGMLATASWPRAESLRTAPAAGPVPEGDAR